MTITARKIAEELVRRVISECLGAESEACRTQTERLDPRKVVVDGRYLRPGDELEDAEGCRITVTRVEKSRMVFELSKPFGESGPSRMIGTYVLSDEDCHNLQAAANAGNVRRRANVRTA